MCPVSASQHRMDPTDAPQSATRRSLCKSRASRASSGTPSLSLLASARVCKCTSRRMATGPPSCTSSPPSQRRRAQTGRRTLCASRSASMGPSERLHSASTPTTRQSSSVPECGSFSCRHGLWDPHPLTLELFQRSHALLCHSHRPGRELQGARRPVEAYTHPQLRQAKTYASPQQLDADTHALTVTQCRSACCSHFTRRQYARP